VCTLTDTGLISTALYIVQPDSSRTTSVLRLQRLTVVPSNKHNYYRSELKQKTKVKYKCTKV